MTKITWAEASARRMERQFLTRPADAGTPVAEVVGAMLRSATRSTVCT